MKSFWLRGGEVVTPLEERFVDLTVETGRVKLLEPQRPQPENSTEIDCTGCYVTPGLFDLQVNGSDACNLWGDPTETEFSLLTKQLLKHGVTSFLPTLITGDLKHIKKNIAFLSSLGAGSIENGKAEAPEKNICMPGIHLEGPYLSPEKPGVHPKEFIRPMNVDEVKGVVLPGVKLMTLAPEKSESSAVIKLLKEKGVAVSLGHSNATFEEGESAFAAGINLMTHTFNALPAIHHRSPGCITAALLNDDVYCCIICDGLHVDPNVVRLLIKTKGVSRVILVTDIAQTGTKGGGLVGSSIYLCEAIRNVVRWQAASFPDAIRMATLNPAMVMNLSDRIGRIGAGARADLVVWDKTTLAIKSVFVNGIPFPI
jgi:N-acetylglucosamine-6-phosphate deacetylase